MRPPQCGVCPFALKEKESHTFLKGNQKIIFSMPTHFRNRRMHIYEDNKTIRNWTEEKYPADDIISKVWAD